MASKFEQLPLEILNEIADYLSPYRDALKIFSALSSRCRDACESTRFRHLCIRTFSRQRLALDVHEITNCLNLDNRYRHVRSIKVVGELPPLLEDDGDLDARLWRISGHNWYGQDELGDENYDNGYSFRHAKIVEDMGEYAMAFEPLLQLLKKTPSLCLFDWHSKGPLPLNILRFLNTSANAKLKLFNFRLAAPSTGLSDYERELVTSPCLHDIRAKVSSQQGRWQDWDFTGEALLQLASGPSSNLAHVVLDHTSLPSMPSMIRPWCGTQPPFRQRPHWTGIPGIPKATGPPVLSSLTFLGRGPSTPSWLSSIDYGMLRTLSLGHHCHDPYTDPRLIWLGRGQEFKALKVLELKISCSAWERVNEALAVFLGYVVNLTSLSLKLSGCDETLQTAVRLRLPSLQYLKLVCRTTKDSASFSHFVEDLATHGQKLESLNLAWPRESHNFDGPKLCASLAKLPQLRRLELKFWVEIKPLNATCASYLEDLKKETMDSGFRDEHHVPITPEIQSETMDKLRRHAWLSEVRLDHTKELFKSMVKSRVQSFADIGWALELLRVSFGAKKDMARTFDLQRNSFALASSEEEMNGLEIKDVGERARIARLWPRVFNSEIGADRYRSMAKEPYDPENDYNRPGLHDYLRERGLLPPRGREQPSANESVDVEMTDG